MLFNLGVDKEQLSSLLENCSEKSIKKNEFLLRANEYCRNTFFVEQGLLRQFSIDDKGREHLIAFAPENWLITDRESFYFNKPSEYYIQVLEDTRVIVLDEDFFRLLSEKFDSFSEFNNKLLHNHIRHLQKRIKLLLSANAEERYLEFIKMYPDILMRVPQSMVASYLGITPESLSRVRRELSNRNM
ncbi:Crp/Fnr family transcriptional regulator [Salegentibacter sp. F14]